MARKKIPNTKPTRERGIYVRVLYGLVEGGAWGKYETTVLLVMVVMVVTHSAGLW